MMSISNKTQASTVLGLALEQGVITPRDVNALGVPASVLQRLVKRGTLDHVARGLYMHPDFEPTAHHTLVEVAALVPKGVVSFLSALAFHDLTDEIPSSVWLTVPRGSQQPNIDVARLELVRSTAKFLTYGVNVHRIEGRDIRITSPARTVVDCFRFRARVGLETALSALRDYDRQHRGGRDRLLQAADYCRVSGVMRPYLEALS